MSVTAKTDKLHKAAVAGSWHHKTTNLLDFLPDYMPNIALMGKPAGE